MSSGSAIAGIAGATASVTQHRCLCCGGVIAGLSDEDISVGLDATLGLVSDECAFSCNDCTARLIEVAAAQRAHTSRRK